MNKLVFVALLAACGSKDKPEDQKPPPNEIISDADYFTKAQSMLTKLGDVFKADGTNCDKLADDLTKITTDPQVAALQIYEHAHPELEKKVNEKMGDQKKAFAALVGPAMGACQNNQKLMDALAKL